MGSVQRPTTTSTVRVKSFQRMFHVGFLDYSFGSYHKLTQGEKENIA